MTDQVRDISVGSVRELPCHNAYQHMLDSPGYDTSKPGRSRKNALPISIDGVR